MGTWISVAFSLIVTWGPTNGLDPTTLTGIYELGEYKVDSADFATWIKKDPEKRAETMKYFAYCALDESQVISAPPYGKWRGWLGLAPIPAAVGMDKPRWHIGFAIPRKMAPEKKMDEAPKTGETIQLPVKKLDAQMETELDQERRWVSACLIAYTNMRGSHQYVALRGHPPSPKSREKLQPTPAERWTEGYPEGVFFGDLFSNPDAKESDPLRSFTVSMDLPFGYVAAAEPPGSPPPPPPAGWQPPNANLGRTLDYRPRTEAEVGDHRPLVARWLGTYRENRERSFRDHAPDGDPDDPDYHADQVCVTTLESPDLTGLAECGSQGASVLRPLFVHLPRLANLESFETKDDPGKPFQVLDRGRKKISPKQVRSCRNETCVGSFAYLAAGGAPEHPARRWFGKKLVGLSDGQVLVPTLRFIEKLEAAGLKAPPSQAYTAIIRYTSPRASRAKVWLQESNGNWRDTKDDVWPPTTSCGATYEWLQVYPVYPDEKSVLRIKIEGVTNGAKGLAPELDAVGFVPGQPWCLADPPDLFMGICPSKTDTTIPGSRAGIAPGRSPKP